MAKKKNEDELELIKKKLMELESALKSLSEQHSVHLSAVFDLMISKGISSPKEIIAMLSQAKEKVSAIESETEFERMMNSLKLKGLEEEDKGRGKGRKEEDDEDEDEDEEGEKGIST